jgi:transposase-like protein
MSQYRRVPTELKEKILDAVKNDGISVRQASEEYEVSQQSIHAWLRKESTYTGSNTHNL